jgi:hypothetical protein
MGMISYIKEFEETLDGWLAHLERYDALDLKRRPDSETWSLGQRYNHLILETEWYLNQHDICCSNPENKGRCMSEKARVIFEAHEFPAIKISGHTTVVNLPQPINKAQWHDQMSESKNYLTKIEINETSYLTSKKKHPRLWHFNGLE